MHKARGSCAQHTYVRIMRSGFSKVTHNQNRNLRTSSLLVRPHYLCLQGSSILGNACTRHLIPVC